MPWIDANCHVKPRQAQNYMKLAADMPQLLDDSNTHPGAYLPGIKQAIELLSAPDDVKTEVNSRLEAGEDVTMKEIKELKAPLPSSLKNKHGIVDIGCFIFKRGEKYS